MTLIVGIRCSDGVVMASDSAATFGMDFNRTIGQQDIRKVHKVGEAMLFGGSGAVGIAQLIRDALGSAWSHSTFRSPATSEEAMRNIAEEIRKQVGPHLQMANLTRPLGQDVSSSLCKSLVAMPVKKKACLFSFDSNGAPEEITVEIPFVAIGSGQQIADPFLAFLKGLLWKGTPPTLAQGRLVAVWTVEHVKKTNPGGVAGATQLATLASDVEVAKAVTLYEENQLLEHLEQIHSAEKALAKQLCEEKPASELSSPPAAPGGTS